MDPYNTINAVEKQKPLAPSRNWISLMSSLAHWWYSNKKCSHVIERRIRNVVIIFFNL